MKLTHGVLHLTSKSILNSCDLLFLSHVYDTTSFLVGPATMNCKPMPSIQMYLFQTILFTLFFLCHTQSSPPRLFLMEYPEALPLETEHPTEI